MRYLLFLALFLSVPSTAHGRPVTPWIVVVRPAAPITKNVSSARKRLRERGQSGLRRVRNFFHKHRRSIAVGITLLLLLGRFVPGLNGVLLLGRGIFDRSGGSILRLKGIFRQKLGLLDTKTDHRQRRKTLTLVSLVFFAIGCSILIAAAPQFGVELSSIGLILFGGGLALGALLLLLIGHLVIGRRTDRQPSPDGDEISKSSPNLGVLYLLFLVIGVVTAFVLL